MLGDPAMAQNTEIGSMVTSAGPEPFLPVPKSYLNQKINTKFNKIWKKRWKETTIYRQTKLWFETLSQKIEKFVKKGSRSDIGKLVQFITGHCNLLRHKSLQDKSIEPMCRLCNEEEETPWHLATECPVLMTNRGKFFHGQILCNVEWSPGQLLRFCKGSKIWSLLDHQQ